MTDREKAMLWLNSFVKNKEPMTLIPKQLIRLMHDVLKEQEAMLVEYSAFGGLKYGGCPRCNARIDNFVNPKACGYCGQELKWE